MNILMISGSYPKMKCGVGDYTNKLVESLDNIGENVTVLTSDKAEGAGNIHNTIHRWKGAELFLSLIRELMNDYDVVHIQFPTIAYEKSFVFVALPLICRAMGKKVIYTMHEYPGPKKLSIALFLSNKIVLVDKKFKESLESNLQYRYRKKLNLINIGSNISKSEATEYEVTEIRNHIFEEHLDCDTIVSYFGFMTVNKKIELILEAMHSLKEEKKLTTIFLIIGDYYAVNEQNVKYQTKLKRMIEEYDLSNSIYMTGFLDEKEVGDYFRSSDAAILLFDGGVSLRNGSFLAALQENLPIITTDNGEIDSNAGVYPIANTVDNIRNMLEKIQNREITRDCNWSRPVPTWMEVARKHKQIYLDVTGDASM